MKKSVLLALGLISIFISSSVSYAGIVAGPPKNLDGMASIEESRAAKSPTLDRQVETAVAKARKLAGYNDDEYVRRLNILVKQAKTLALKAANQKEKAKWTYVYNMLEIASTYGGARALPNNIRKLVEDYVTWNKENMNPESIITSLKNPNDAKAKAIAKKEGTDLMTKPVQFVLDTYAASNKDNTLLQKAINEVVERCRLDASKIDITMPGGKKYSEMRVAFFGMFQGKPDQDVKKTINGIIAMILQG